MTVGGVIAWLVVGGAVGGVSDLFFHLRYTRDGFAYKPPTGEVGSIVPVTGRGFVGICLVSAFIGIAGAIGAQLALILIQKFSSDSTVETKLLLLSTSVVAGFGARRLLPQIRDRLEEELIRTREESREAAEEAHEASAQVKVLASLRPNAPASERDYCIRFLKSSLEKEPTDRTNAIILGRLQRVAGNLTGAIGSLSQFLEKKGDIHDKDYADVLYNRACYYSMLWGQEKNKEYLDSAIRDLRLSFAISPENKKDAESDDDFEAIRDNEDFKNLLLQNGEPPTNGGPH